jgi:hypothetical protein
MEEGRNYINYSEARQEIVKQAFVGIPQDRIFLIQDMAKEIVETNHGRVFPALNDQEENALCVLIDFVTNTRNPTEQEVKEMEIIFANNNN